MPRYGRELALVPEGGGAYGLLLRCSSERRVRVGALGTISLQAGWYCYAGSARNGLRARLARHLRTRGKRTHWHIDYVRRRTRPVALLIRAGEGADECALSDVVAALADASVKGFGCSDCRCWSHLHYFRDAPLRRLERVGAELIALVTEA